MKERLSWVIRWWWIQDVFSRAHRSLETSTGWLGSAGGLYELSWRSGVGTRLVLWLGSVAGKERWEGARDRMKPSCCSIEVGQWGFGGGTSKTKSMARGKVWKSSIWGSKSKSQRMDQHVNTAHEKILSTSLERVREGETKLMKIDVVPGGMFALASIRYSDI